MGLVRFHNDGSAYRLRGKRAAKARIAALIRGEGFGQGDISVIFCSPEIHLEINRRYLGHDYPTDVITFDYSENGVLAGDIFVDPATVRLNAAAYGCRAADEMLRVIIHGVLHLAGYKDSTPGERAAMRAKEDFHLKQRP